jgi:geranylgeranyl diphosphate synthase, type II
VSGLADDAGRGAGDLQQYLRSRRDAVDAALELHLPAESVEPAVIHRAMRYSVFAGGKRIRPVLALAAAEAIGADAEPLVRHAAALELVHTYSLIHDDLPALDDDDLRRGRPTSHVVFGEAMAILAGDALLTEAFSWLAVPMGSMPAGRQLRAIALVAAAVDSRGMIGGQVADIESEHLAERETSRELLEERLDFIHRNKTGKLLTASVMLGGLLGGASDDQLALLETYGGAIGLAFQIVDDLLDVEESAETLGKTAGKDLAQGKLTWPALRGADAARAKLGELLDTAVATAGMIGGPLNYLGGIARYVCERRS